MRFNKPFLQAASDSGDRQQTTDNESEKTKSRKNRARGLLMVGLPPICVALQSGTDRRCRRNRRRRRRRRRRRPRRSPVLRRYPAEVHGSPMGDCKGADHHHMTSSYEYVSLLPSKSHHNMAY